MLVSYAGATGLSNLLRDDQKVVPSKTVDMPVLFGVPKKVEDEEEDVKLEYKSAAEKEAISVFFALLFACYV